MNPLPVIFKAIDLGIGALQFVVNAYDRIRRILKPKPKPEESHPLTWRDVAHQQEQIRAATTKKP